MGFEEKRKHPRFEAKLELNLLYNDFEDLATETMNISEGGLFVRTNSPLPMGTKVALKISLVHMDIIYVQAEGEVVHTKGQNDPQFENDQIPGMGIRFTNIDPQSERFIKEFIRRKANG